MLPRCNNAAFKREEKIDNYFVYCIVNCLGCQYALFDMCQTDTYI